MRRDQRRVELEDDAWGCRTRLPRPSSRGRPRPANRGKLRLADREHHPPRRRNRRDVTKQGGLTTEYREIRHAFPAIGHNDCEISEHAARMMS